tara:strand:- start:26637 stop:27236 length:600 start_codon:yes stop_codon:yes gene_type:complete
MIKSSHTTKLIEVGCDEAGRGSLAGPVVSCSVIFPKKIKIKEINDSKLLSKNKRIKLEKIIKEKAIDYSFGIANVEEIDKINILNASILSMHRSLSQIKEDFDLILVDGNRFKNYKDKKHVCIVKGDSKYVSIAAASILAKNFRDKLMIDLSKIYDKYDFENNKGYPTKNHKKFLMQHGQSLVHRKTFKIKELQHKLFY